ncbi:hypothetical protein LNTAR_00960 [Lentisphaera araneosa HTCC2155]|uniref:Uncharacterized protein n=1 Tax=Lentisphaera araneosa HTCC2155 TaxID=313628 RepID=A6DKM9_9BACT|nr:hypothetical protein [Lentisphaera araneosa]EDM27927.1 hypothetical protein LNTAR_00960 [Lentisphaera araneosa HTCC2155]
MRLLSILLFTFCLSVSAEEIKTSQWKGFERHDFKFENRKAHVVVPKKAMEGKPWVWRAKQNPEKVNAIYAEAPVCDIKSWPGGKGKGVGAKAQWTQSQKVYEMDEAGLMAWKGNPIDDIALLAKAGVPLFFVTHKDDMIVPNAENTDVLVNKYREAGGEAQVHVHTGESKSKGHHFKIEKVDEAVEFILKNSKKEGNSRRAAKIARKRSHQFATLADRSQAYCRSAFGPQEREKLSAIRWQITILL